MQGVEHNVHACYNLVLVLIHTATFSACQAFGPQNASLIGCLTSLFHKQHKFVSEPVVKTPANCTCPQCFKPTIELGKRNKEVQSVCL